MQSFLKASSFVEDLKQPGRKAIVCLQYFIQGLCIKAPQNAFFSFGEYSGGFRIGEWDTW